MRLFPAERIKEFYELGWWSHLTLDSLLATHVAQRADEESLVDAPNRATFTDGMPKRLTWAKVDDYVDRVAAALIDNGVEADHVVGIQLPNVVELSVLYLATAKIGAIASPFPVQYREHELSMLGRVAGISTFVTTCRIGNRANAEALLGLLGEIPTLERVLCFGERVPDRAVGLDDWLTGPFDRAGLDRHLSLREIDPADCITISWTSGTESVPKGVPRAHGDWLAIMSITVDAPGVTADDVMLNPFPMVNAGGVGGMFMPWISQGCRLVQHQPFDLEVFLQTVTEEHVTYSVSPPAILTRLLLEPDLLASHDISSIRALGSGSTPLTPFLIEGWEARGVEVINFFGSNEGISLTGYRSNIPDATDRARYFAVPGRGRPSRVRIDQWTQIRLVDLKTGADIDEAGHPGELRIRGPSVFAGYWGGAGDPFDDQGYYKSGDVFEYVGADLEYLLFVDRANDLIIRGGFKISPAEVEGLIQSHPKVAEVAAVGSPHPVLGETVCLFVVVRPGETLTLEELIDYLRQQRIAVFKLPERLELVESLPRSPIGKVLKRELRDQLKEELVVEEST